MLLKDIISEYRIAHNLSQRAFAAKCGVTNGYMSMIENGLNPSTGKALIPSFSKLKQIANGMEMTVHQLVQIADDMEIDIGVSESIEYGGQQFSSAALAVAKAYDSMSDYGKAIIDCIISQEEKQKKESFGKARILCGGTKYIPIGTPDGFKELNLTGAVEIKEASRRELKQEENTLNSEKI